MWLVKMKESPNCIKIPLNTRPTLQQTRQPGFVFLNMYIGKHNDQRISHTNLFFPL